MTGIWSTWVKHALRQPSPQVAAVAETKVTAMADLVDEHAANGNSKVTAGTESRSGSTASS